MPASVTLVFWAGQKQGGCSVGSARDAEMWPGRGHGRLPGNQVLWATWQGKPPLMLLHPYLPLSFVFLTISLGLLPVSSASTAVQSFPDTSLLSSSLCFSSGLFCTQLYTQLIHNKGSRASTLGEEHSFLLWCTGNHHCFSLDILATDFIPNHIGRRW